VKEILTFTYQIAIEPALHDKASNLSLDLSFSLRMPVKDVFKKGCLLHLAI
jgi:hypothetical protein